MNSATPLPVKDERTVAEAVIASLPGIHKTRWAETASEAIGIAERDNIDVRLWDFMLRPAQVFSPAEQCSPSIVVRSGDATHAKKSDGRSLFLADPHGLPALTDKLAKTIRGPAQDPELTAIAVRVEPATPITMLGRTESSHATN